MSSPYRHRANPYAYYSSLRAKGPLMYNGTLFLARHQDVAVLLRSPDLSTQTISRADAFMAQSMGNMDPPDHGRIRSILGSLFTAPAIEKLRNQIQDKAWTLVQAMKPNKDLEFMSQFAEPLAVEVISNLIGIPHEHRQHVLGLYKGLYQKHRGNPNPNTLALRSYFQSALSEPANHRPQDTVLFHLTSAHEQGRLSESEMSENCIAFLIGGIAPPQHLLGTGLLALLRHQDQFQMLIDRPDMIPQAVEEMLRYEPPSAFTSLRIAQRSIRLGHVEVPEGAKVIGLIAAANHDPDVFPSPDRFEIQRRPTKHLAFGGGIHQCIGNLLLRHLATIAFQQLIQGLPTLRLRRGIANLQPSHTWVRNAKTRGLRHLFLTP